MKSSRKFSRIVIHGGGKLVENPDKCECGEIPYIDWWYNFRQRYEEVFVRCPGCGFIGPVGKNEEEALELWHKLRNTPQ